jgi:hypothetical protein
MINSVEAVGRFQKIVFGITMWLLAASIFLTIIIFVRCGSLWLAVARCGVVARVLFNFAHLRLMCVHVAAFFVVPPPRSS